MIRLRFLDRFRHSRLPILHSFSSLSVSQEGLSSPRDQHLLNAIRTQFDRDIQQASVPIPRPPEPFKIIQKNGIRLLRRTYGAEEIFVKGELVKYVPAGPKLYEESDDEVEEMVKIVVSIHKTPEEPVLEIDCLSDGDDIVVCRFACVEGHSASNTYFGREEFRRRIQKRLWKFLHRRAINKDMASYLINYLSHKDSRQFLVWLKHVEGFIVR